VYMVDMEMNMTFDEAVEVVKEYTGCRGMLLDGLELIQEEVDYASDHERAPAIPVKVMVAFRFICAQMRPLFV
jgi:hypothetical protein